MQKKRRFLKIAIRVFVTLPKYIYLMKLKDRVGGSKIHPRLQIPAYSIERELFLFGRNRIIGLLCPYGTFLLILPQK